MSANLRPGLPRSRLWHAGRVRGEWPTRVRQRRQGYGLVLSDFSGRRMSVIVTFGVALRSFQEKTIFGRCRKNLHVILANRRLMHKSMKLKEI